MTTGPTVLVIDDNINLARGFAVALEQNGYCAHVAHSAEDGLALAHTQQPRVIVVDLRMPFINGLGYLYRLRELPGLARTPVLVVTGAEVDEETQRDLATLGATLRYKPITVSELLAEIGRLTETGFSTSP